MIRTRTHPGKILREEYLAPLGLSARALGEALQIPGNRISDILRGRRDITADTAIRLGLYFGADPQFWLNLQAAHDLSKAKAKSDYREIKPLGPRTNSRDRSVSKSHVTT